MEPRLKGTTPKWNYSNHILEDFFVFAFQIRFRWMFVWCHSAETSRARGLAIHDFLSSFKAQPLSVRRLGGISSFIVQLVVIP